MMEVVDGMEEYLNIVMRSQGTWKRNRKVYNTGLSYWLCNEI